MCMSKSKQFLAYSYIANPAIILVHDLKNQRKKPKILTCSDIKATEYIALLFRKEEVSKLK